MKMKNENEIRWNSLDGKAIKITAELNEGDIDIGLSDKEGLHKVFRHARGEVVPAGSNRLAPVFPGIS